MLLQLIRDVATQSYTYGRLTLGGLVLQTLELPWRPQPGQVCGRPDRSCVPAGTYSLALHDSHRHPRTWALVNPALGIYHEPADVPRDCFARVACLLHVANFVDQLEGCVGLGNARETAQPPAVWQSGAAMRALQGALPWTGGHELVISYAPGVTA